MNVFARRDIADAFRAARSGPVETGTALALMLLWSQTPASGLGDLPPLEDASTEFVLRDPDRIARQLCPLLTRQIGALFGAARVQDFEILRRAVLNSVNGRLDVSEIAEEILDSCVPDAWISAQHTTLLLAALDPTPRSRIYCAFYYSIRPAWELGKRFPVTLEIDRADLLPLLKMLAAACQSALEISLNSIDAISREAKRPFHYEYALVFPPIGVRHKLDRESLPLLDATLAGEPIAPEAFATIWGAQIGGTRNLVVVSNGFLFRTSSREAALKHDLIDSYGLAAVVSLPRGTFPRSGIATSVLVFGGSRREKPRGRLRFVDGSDPRSLDSKTLTKLLNGRGQQEQCIDVAFSTLAQAGYNLSVDRYVLDATARKSRDILEAQETVSLSDVADIRRSQALPREIVRDKPLVVREALLADAHSGRLTLPEKMSEVPFSAMRKIEGGIVKPGDVLLSVKGTIGKVAIVSEEVVAQSQPAPIIAGQSFVIIRLRQGSPIRESEVLAAYLRSPVAQSLLQGMAGGAVIANVAMGDIKAMPVPILTVAAQAEIVKKVQEVRGLQRQIEKLREKMDHIEAEIFDVSLSG